ncbi:MAG: hypothetical protein ACLKAK_12310 [Alkaliphilus sp.]
MSDCGKSSGLLSCLCGGDSSLLFFFLILVIICCNCPAFRNSGDSLLFFFLLLVFIFGGRGLFGY